MDKLTFAALEATLLAYVQQKYDAIPALRMMRCSVGEITERCQQLAKNIRNPRLKLEVIAGESVIGGGAAPAASLPTSIVALTGEDFSADELAAKLRGYIVPIVARVEEGRVLLDLRTVFPEQDAVLAAALRQI